VTSYRQGASRSGIPSRLSIELVISPHLPDHAFLDALAT
jgi:hypothetical protein